MSQGIVTVEHLSTIEEVTTSPLEIPYDLTPMKVYVDPVTPLTIIVPTSFPYENMKAIPWIYDSTIYIHGRKVEDEPLESKEPTVNITGIGGVTRRGRIFAPVPPTNDNGGTSDHGNGK